MFVGTVYREFAVSGRISSRIKKCLKISRNFSFYFLYYYYCRSLLFRKWRVRAAPFFSFFWKPLFNQLLPLLRCTRVCILEDCSKQGAGTGFIRSEVKKSKRKPQNDKQILLMLCSLLTIIQTQCVRGGSARAGCVCVCWVGGYLVGLGVWLCCAVYAQEKQYKNKGRHLVRLFFGIPTTFAILVFSVFDSL